MMLCLCLLEWGLAMPQQPPNEPSLTRRSSGVLLHPTSLPSPYGIGDLGPEAHEFVDFLARSGQAWWQMLPIGPVGPGHSPYASPSSFAGNPLLLSLDRLVADGLLSPHDLPSHQPVGRVGYDRLYGSRDALYRRAFANFRPDADFDRFRAENKGWLRNFALFSAVKQENGGAPWWNWDPGLRSRDPRALRGARRRLAPEIRYQEFLQYEFSKQWDALRQVAKLKGVGLIGDLPIYVAHDSVDVWTNQDLFELDSQGRPTRVSGAPPDAFNTDGQRWGNPLYRWDVLRQRGYDWWIGRLEMTLRRFDAVRLDHFIGFERYWAIPGDALTAKTGTWIPGPSTDFFDAIRKALGTSRMVAEDLGAVTPEVHALRDRFQLPGMRVIQFGFSGDGYHRPDRSPKIGVVYTGTHDTDTVRGWFSGIAGTERAEVLRYVGTDGREIHWDLIKATQASPANLVIVPAQDLLGLDGTGRMNAPGVANGNWSWRVAPGALDAKVADRLRTLSGTNGRVAHRASSMAASTAGGLGTFAAAYLLKEALKLAEHRDGARFREAVQAIRTKEWWIALGVFSGASYFADLGLARIGAGGLFRSVLPLTAGMAAVQLLSGKASWRELAISTGSFLAAGTIVSLFADGLLYPILFAAGPPGWLAAGVYTVAKLGVTLYAGEKLESWIRGLLEKNETSGREGVRQKIDALSE